MELRTTVRNFIHDMTTYRISSDTRIRVIIDEPQSRREPIISDRLPVPAISSREQRQRLDTLPQGYEPHESDEFIALIESSHTNTEPVEW